MINELEYFHLPAAIGTPPKEFITLYRVFRRDRVSPVCTRNTGIRWSSTLLTGRIRCYRCSYTYSGTNIPMFAWPFLARMLATWDSAYPDTDFVTFPLCCLWEPWLRPICFSSAESRYCYTSHANIDLLAWTSRFFIAPKSQLLK